MTTEPNSQDQNKRASTIDDDKEHEILVLRERIQELEELVKKSMETNPALGFRTATSIVDQQIADHEREHGGQPGPGMEALISATGIVPNEVIFPSDLLSKFFIASRNVKDHVKLKLNGTTVEAWVIS